MSKQETEKLVAEAWYEVEEEADEAFFIACEQAMEDLAREVMSRPSCIESDWSVLLQSFSIHGWVQQEVTVVAVSYEEAMAKASALARDLPVGEVLSVAQQ